MLIEILVAMAVIVLGGGYAIARLTRQPEGVKRILAAAEVPIGEAPEAADVKIVGVVEVLDGATVASPLAGKRCVYFEHTVEEVFDATLSGGGIVRHREVGGVPFAVRDETGVAVVDPEGAVALLAVDHQTSTRGHGWTAPITGVQRSGSHHLDQERLLVAGDTVMVIGRGVREPDPDPAHVGGTYRDGPATRLRLSRSAGFALHIADISPRGRK